MLSLESGSPVAERRLFAADVAQAGVVRRWAGAALAGHPCRDDALLVVAEPFANAVLHGSRGPDSVVAVAVRRLAEGRAYVAVADSGRGGRPMPRDAGPGDVAGRGLAIVDGLAAWWGIGRDGPGGWRGLRSAGAGGRYVAGSARVSRERAEDVRKGTVMSEPGTRRVGADWAGGERPMPWPFVRLWRGPRPRDPVDLIPGHRVGL